MTTPPREGFRAVAPETLTYSERADAANGDGRTLTGHFSVFNRWTEINSMYEGHFLERIAPGAFKKTLSERTPKVLFQHGRDPQIGDKPLGTVNEVREDGDVGAYYNVSLFDTAYNRELIPGLKAGVYGASFRFRAVREDYDENPEKADWNPDRLPLRTIKEAQVSEFGPVTFGAYPEATSGVRSFTDEVFLQSFDREPERLLRYVEDRPELLALLAERAKHRTVVDLAAPRKRARARLTALARSVRADGAAGMPPADVSALAALLARLAAADAAFDPIVDAVVGADMALDDAQATIADLLGVENPDADDADAGDDGRNSNVADDEDAADKGTSSDRANAPVTDAADSGTSGARRDDSDPNFIKIGSLKPIPRIRKE